MAEWLWCQPAPCTDKYVFLRQKHVRENWTEDKTDVWWFSISSVGQREELRCSFYTFISETDEYNNRLLGGGNPSPPKGLLGAMGEKGAWSGSTWHLPGTSQDNQGHSTPSAYSGDRLLNQWARGTEKGDEFGEEREAEIQDVIQQSSVETLTCFLLL